MTRILSYITSLPHTDFNLITHYIMPTLRRIQEKLYLFSLLMFSPSQQVALTLAECLTDIARSGPRLLNLAQKEKVKDALQRNPTLPASEISVESNYREDMTRLRSSVKTLLMLAMSYSDEEMPAV